MSEHDAFDFWYAVNNTDVVLRPRQRLETFGATSIRYHLAAEQMDEVNKIRVREGNVHAYRPEIITPQMLTDTLLEGFNEDQAEQYMNWLRSHEQDLLILKYGFTIRKEAINDYTVTDNIDNVIDRIRTDLEQKNQPMTALIRGVEEPWEVCLLKLMVELVQQSVAAHAGQLRQDPQGRRHEIEAMFRTASRDASRIQELAALLQKHKLFGEYEDRFYALVRSSA